eukprot:scaffold13395_cov71-Cyclotella_meneghiniana.AAC.4
MAIAVICLIAEGMPSGRSLVLSSGSFSKATRYVVRRILIMAGEGAEGGWFDFVWLILATLDEAGERLSGLNCIFVMVGVGCGGYGCFCRLLELLWDLDCSAGVLLVVSQLASYRVLISPCRNLLSRCEMSFFRVVTLSGSGFGASGEEFVEGFKDVIMCGEGEAVVADEGLSEGGYGLAQAM